MIREPVVVIGDRKCLLACFANRISRRSNVVTDDFVDSLTSRTDIEGRCDRHFSCSLRENHTQADLHCIINITAVRSPKLWLATAKKENPKCDENVTLVLTVSVMHDKAGVLFLDRPGRREAAGGHARGVRLIEVLSVRRETHSRYLWNTRRECRAGSECAVVSADFVFGWLPKLHLRHV
jgi:hypothetical protein